MKYRLLIICIALFFLLVPVRVQASSLTHLDAVLVLDVSGSMNFADPDRLSFEAMMMFVDMLSVAGDRVGIVTYNDQVVASEPLRLIEGQQDKDEIKDVIANLVVGGFTDITVGLMEAIRLMDAGHRPPNQPVIILFSDGNNYLSPGNPRTDEDLDRDTEQIIIDAQARGYSIYSIGLNYDGTLNHAYIQRFADETGGLSFETTHAENMPDIISAIFANQMEIVIIEAGTLLADGEFQYVTIDIPDDMIVEANITFLSSQPIEVELLDPLMRPIPFDGHWAVFSQATHYAMLKVLTPMQGEWTLRVRGIAGDQIRINLLYQYSLEVMLEVSATEAEAGATIEARVSLLEASEILLQNSAVEIRFGDQSVTARRENGLFIADIPVGDNDFEITAVLEHPNFFRVSDPIAISVTSVEPAPTPPPAPPAIPVAVEEPPEDEAVFYWAFSVVAIAIAVGLAVLSVIAAIILLLRKKRARVFTGRLIIEITDHYTGEKLAPEYRNLIEYGRKADLLSLLRGKGSSLLGGVVLTPSPSAPSHLPQLIIKSNSKDLKFRKDFMEQDASKGIALSMRSELSIQIESENKTVVLRYME